MLDRNNEALESFRTAITLWNLPQNYRNLPGRAAAYQGFGQAMHRLGDDQSALEAYDRAIAVYPGDANSFAGRGDVFDALSMPDRASRLQ